MTLPDPRYTTIDTNEKLILDLIQDLFVHPRSALLKWSEITNQTAQVRIAYPGQHLASLVTGVPGSGTAARGDDLRDGSEIKGCSRVDQLGHCRKCDERVLPFLGKCPSCASTDIHRKEDSHWIMSIRSDQELRQYLQSPRIILILFDRLPSIPSNVRVRVWEIWPTDNRHQYFHWFLNDYWKNNYKLKISKGLSPAPLNLHPLKYDFHMMNPIRIFEANITDSGETEILHWIKPAEDRKHHAADLMPIEAVRTSHLHKLIVDLTDKEISQCIHEDWTVEQIQQLRQISPRQVAKELTGLTESIRLKLPRPVKRPKITPSSYTRRRQA